MRRGNSVEGFDKVSKPRDWSKGNLKESMKMSARRHRSIGRLAGWWPTSRAFDPASPIKRK
jgi:hypothetical protein